MPCKTSHSRAPSPPLTIAIEKPHGSSSSHSSQRPPPFQADSSSDLLESPAFTTHSRSSSGWRPNVAPGWLSRWPSPPRGSSSRSPRAVSMASAVSARRSLRWLEVRLSGSPAFLPALVHVHQRLTPVAAAGPRPRGREAYPPPEQQTNAQGDQHDRNDRSSQVRPARSP